MVSSAQLIWRAILIAQPPVGSSVVRETFRTRIPFQKAARLKRDVSDQRGAGGKMPGQDIGIALSAAFDAVQEIAGMRHGVGASGALTTARFHCRLPHRVDGAAAFAVQRIAISLA